MKSHMVKTFALATALMFLNSVWQLPTALASAELSQVDLAITVKVNQQGFLNEQGKLYGGKNTLKIPKGKIVRITFTFDEKLTSLAYGDTHQIAITGEEVGTKESEKIWMFSQQTSITIQTGKEGEQYRAYCIIDCIGMEHLNNLVIEVV